MQRKFVTFLLIGGALIIAFALSQSDQNATKTTTPAPEVKTSEVVTSEGQVSETSEGVASEAPATPVVVEPVVAVNVDAIEGLRVRAVTDVQVEPVLGSVAGDQGEGGFKLEAVFTPWGGGIKSVKLGDYTMAVDSDDPYVVLKQLEDGSDAGKVLSYPMAASWVEVNGARLYLSNQRWTVGNVTETGVNFTLVVEDGTGGDVLRITRVWSVQAGRYDLSVGQKFENLSGDALKVRYGMVGPVDLPMESGYLGDRDRHVITGYVEPPHSETGMKRVMTDGYDKIRSDYLSLEGTDVVWPGVEEDPNRDLAWLATTNRYFAALVYEPVADRAGLDRPLEGKFPHVRRKVYNGFNAETKDAIQLLALHLDSTEMVLAAGGAGANQSLDLALYAGPRERSILRNDEGYSLLGMGLVIVYSMGGPCAMCTFAWLAESLLAFLTFMAGISGDWGFAIIVLVAVVRTILHPLTKKSQVNMMVMSKKMGALAPDIEKLKAKYPDNQKKMNEEMMKLYKEKNVNPAAMGLGCLPMFLQMPIWIALYAMLYYAIELRHEGAFWGVFQMISGGNWAFMADMASEDGFISLGQGFRIPGIGTQISSFNVLPFLMGGVFYLQQKYTTAQSTATMSDQQIQQQKMMKWMIFLFPVMLYKAPCGLTLYILTSTTVGIIESKRVRAHIKEMEDNGHFDGSKKDDDGGAKKKKGPKPGGFMDRMMKAAEARQREADKQNVGQGQAPGTKPVKSKSKKKRGQL